MSREIWNGLLTEMGYMQVPRALRLKRKELGLTNNEYTILLDYVDYHTYYRSVNPYRHLSEVSGMSERTIRRTLSTLEKKGLLSRELRSAGNGRTRGVIFSLTPLVRKLRDIMTKPPPTVGEEIVPLVPDGSVPLNTREDINTKQESNKKKSAEYADARAPGGSENEIRDGRKELEEFPGEPGCRGGSGRPSEKARGDDSPCCKAHQSPNAPAVRRQGGLPGPGESIPQRAGGSAGSEGAPAVVKEKKWKDPYCAARWYNDVFSEMYERAAGQPVLTGGREYKSAETYFRRLRELNPGTPAEGIFERATDGALFAIMSQLEGGVFGWMHKPPDICVLASQAQSVDYHLRKIYAEREGAGGKGYCNADGETVRLSFIEKIKEGEYASEQIGRVYDDLREIERASRRRAEGRGEGRGARQDAPGDNAPEQKALAGGLRFSRKRRGR